MASNSFASIVQVVGGFAVKLEHTFGSAPEFLGVDGFWSRSAETATPFTSEVLALDAVYDLNGDEHPRK